MGSHKPAAGNARKTKEFNVPVQLRVGGAFLAIAVALLMLGLIALVRDGMEVPFVWTIPRVLIVVAAAIVGAFATMNRNQRGSIVQVVALAVGIILVGVSRLAPKTFLFAQPVYWLFVYAGAAVVCALLLRRSVMA